jgi:Ala-tRNA(Pro) deacylase
MAIPDQLSCYLERSGVPYTHTLHRTAYTAHEVALAEHIPDHELAKSVVFRTERGFIMAVVPGDREVDTEALRKKLGVALRIATEGELAELFPEFQVGAMPPFGNIYGVHVYVDRSLADVPTIAFNAGTHNDVIFMDYADFERLARPFVLTISRAKSGPVGDHPIAARP